MVKARIWNLAGSYVDRAGAMVKVCYGQRITGFIRPVTQEGAGPNPADLPAEKTIYGKPARGAIGTRWSPMAQSCSMAVLRARRPQ